MSKVQMKQEEMVEELRQAEHMLSEALQKMKNVQYNLLQEHPEWGELKDIRGAALKATWKLEDVILRMETGEDLNNG